MSKKPGIPADAHEPVILLPMTQKTEDIMVEAALGEWQNRTENGTVSSPEDHVRALIRAALAAVVLDSVPEVPED